MLQRTIIFKPINLILRCYCRFNQRIIWINHHHRAYNKSIMEMGNETRILKEEFQGKIVVCASEYWIHFPVSQTIFSRNWNEKSQEQKGSTYSQVFKQNKIPCWWNNRKWASSIAIWSCLQQPLLQQRFSIWRLNCKIHNELLASWLTIT